MYKKKFQLKIRENKIESLLKILDIREEGLRIVIKIAALSTHFEGI